MGLLFLVTRLLLFATLSCIKFSFTFISWVYDNYEKKTTKNIKYFELRIGFYI